MFVPGPRFDPDQALSGGKGSQDHKSSKKRTERDCSKSQNQLKMSSEQGKEEPEWGHWGLRGKQERVQKGNNTKLDTKGKILRQYVCLYGILQSLNK